MNRREVIQRATMILGYAITGPALTGILNGCKAAPEQAFTPVFFTDDQASLVAALTEIIIPRTDTPGAIDAGVPMFIDRMLKEVYPKESQETFLKNLAAFDEGALKAYGNNFLDCDDEEKIAYFKKEHDGALQNSAGGLSSGWWNAGVNASKPFVLELKGTDFAGLLHQRTGSDTSIAIQTGTGTFQRLCTS